MPSGQSEHAKWKVHSFEKSSFYTCKISYCSWLQARCLTSFDLQSGTVVIPASCQQCFEAKCIDISKVFIVTHGKGLEVINHSLFVISVEECEANTERMSQFMSRRKKIAYGMSGPLCELSFQGCGTKAGSEHLVKIYLITLKEGGILLWAFQFLTMSQQ